MQVSGSHRLDTNKAEQARVKALGCEVGATTLEGKAVGPLRVWPGGLAMSRTLGDFEVSTVDTVLGLGAWRDVLPAIACFQAGGQETGPLRVWPGGLAMGCMLVDCEAGSGPPS